jgi:hypothetical protein
MALLVVKYDCPAAAWTKVASNVTSALIQRGNSVAVRVAVSDVGDAAPASAADETAGYSINDPDDWLPLSSPTAFDVWVRPRGGDTRDAIIFNGAFA